MNTVHQINSFNCRLLNKMTLLENRCTGNKKYLGVNFVVFVVVELVVVVANANAALEICHISRYYAIYIMCNHSCSNI